MPVEAIKKLLPVDVRHDNKRYVLLEDRHIFDSVTVATTDRSAKFFVTLSGKENSQANFRGDQSLVREGNIFVPIQISIFPRLRILTSGELGFFTRGYVTFQITSPQKITVLEDNMRNLAPYAGYYRTADQSGSPVDELQPAGRTFAQRRTILIPENKIVMGGRNIDFSLAWSESSGNDLVQSTEVVAEFYGGEYEPAKG